jgi:hypothetical protein
MIWSASDADGPAPGTPNGYIPALLGAGLAYALTRLLRKRPW